MRFSILPLLIASAGLAQHVSASPIRIVVTEVTNVRLGHAVANANTEGGNNNNIAHGMLITSSTTELDDAGRPKMHRRPCGKGGMRAKALALSNTFRKALGLPLIDPHPNFTAIKNADGEVSIMPVSGKPHPHHQHHTEGERVHHHKFKHHQGAFLRRVHKALMALGPWEGRAVAFVLGCGIGVLLRMFWVMAVISYRMIRGQREEDEYPEVIFIEDAEELVLPPPQYTDEKVQPADAPVA